MVVTEIFNIPRGDWACTNSVLFFLRRRREPGNEANGWSDVMRFIIQHRPIYELLWNRALRTTLNSGHLRYFVWSQMHLHTCMYVYNQNPWNAETPIFHNAYFSVSCVPISVSVKKFSMWTWFLSTYMVLCCLCSNLGFAIDTACGKMYDPLGVWSLTRWC